MTTQSNNSILFLGYDRPIAGREMAAVSVIEHLTKLLDKAKKENLIESYDSISLAVHGGNVNGFLLVRGNRKGLDDLRASDEFDDLAVQAHMVMSGVSILSGVHGEAVVTRRMDRIKKLTSANFA